MSNSKEKIREWIAYLFPKYEEVEGSACAYLWVSKLSKVAPRAIGMLVFLMFGIAFVTKNREEVFIIIALQTLFLLGIYGILLLFLKWKKRNPAVLRILGIFIPLYGTIGVIGYTMLSSHIHNKFNESPRTKHIRETTSRVRSTIDERRKSIDERFAAHEKAFREHYDKTHNTIQEIGSKMDKRFEEKKNGFLKSFEENWNYRMKQREERDQETRRRVQKWEEEQKQLAEAKEQEKDAKSPSPTIRFQPWEKK